MKLNLINPQQKLICMSCELVEQGEWIARKDFVIYTSFFIICELLF